MSAKACAPVRGGADRGRAKYRRGRPVRSIGELVRQDFVYFANCVRPVHRGWFSSWPIRLAVSLIERRMLFRAVRNVRREKRGGDR